MAPRPVKTLTATNAEVAHGPFREERCDPDVASGRPPRSMPPLLSDLAHALSEIDMPLRSSENMKPTCRPLSRSTTPRAFES